MRGAVARRRGVSRQYVSRLVKEGVIRLKNGKVDPAQADAALAARRDPARPMRRKKVGAKTPQPHIITGEHAACACPEIFSA